MFKRLVQANINHYTNHPKRHLAYLGMYIVASTAAAFFVAKRAGELMLEQEQMNAAMADLNSAQAGFDKTIQHLDQHIADSRQELALGLLGVPKNDPRLKGL